MEDYRKIFELMDHMFEEIYEIGELAESRGFFPVMQFLNLQSEFEDFYHALRGASEKSADFNYKMAKQNLSSIYGKVVFKYADTDSCRVNSDDDDEDDDDCPTQYDYRGCFMKRVCERVTGEHCKKCPHAWKCFKVQNN